MNITRLGDSRGLLEEIGCGTINVVYLDPPFNSNRQYRLSTQTDSIGFDDIFSTDQEYVDLVEPMVKECSRVLADDGSFFFHISADQMLIPHMICSKYFKKVQPIFWQRSRSKNNVKTKLGACTDVIFWCAHKEKPRFNMVYQPLDAYYAENSYKNKDKRGNYALGHVCYTKTQAPDREKTPHRYYEITHEGKTYSPQYGWRMSKEDLEALIDDDRVHFPNKSGSKPYKKIYAHESKGKPSTDYWNDIHSIAQGSEERVYPTQKPVALLRRIIEMTSNEGDIVLDPTAGSGTTGVAAAQLGRQYVLFDISPDAIESCIRRIRLEGNNS
jgi:DNA modification methylase